MPPSSPSASRATTPVALQATNLVKSFDGHRAVDGVTLSVAAGEVLALLGPNGAGKTTTVEMCEGFLRPDRGSVELLGHDPVADNDSVRGRIGVMLQGGGGYPGARAGEMLRLVASYSADPIDPEWLLDQLGLREVQRTPYRRLSGGLQQRLALACALVGRPEVVFLDEPTAGMDAHARIMVWELISRLRGDGVAVLLTTHMMDEAEQLSDRLMIIDRGAVVAEGTPAELTHRDAVNELRFRARRGLDMRDLEAQLPEAYSASSQESGPLSVGEPHSGTYLVSGHITPDILVTVTQWCAQQNVLATDLRVQTRSLEDVFLEITGREIRQ